jgi:hypothetical protein
MCTVFLGHDLGRRGCGPKGFRHHGEKGPVVDNRIGAFYRIYHLFDIRVQKRQKNRAADLENTQRCHRVAEIPRCEFIV